MYSIVHTINENILTRLVFPRIDEQRDHIHRKEPVWVAHFSVGYLV